ncbi:DUF7507 domain-containing protein, partial [Methanobrevibacter millerae]|uniref:DUF7507 domain-containing protein n=1 Tax=Methanobrevibacter millerae TaxID=230361 RepID=UPI001CB70502
MGDSIHTFVEEDFRKSSNPNIQHVVSLYDSGFRVPTINATKVLPDGTVKIYNFYTIINSNCYQNCFYYKVITIGKTNIIPDLTVRKITLNKTVQVGEQTSFTIVVKNTGNVDLNRVTVTEQSYEGLTFNSASTNGLWTHSIVNGKNVWTFNPTLKQGMTARFNVTFDTTKPGNFTNVIIARSDKTNNKTTNNTTEVIDNPKLTPDIEVSKITLTPVVLVGQQTSFEIIVKNTGEVVLTKVFLEETSYDGLVYDSFVDNGAWTHSVINGKNVWTLNKNLDLNETASLFVNFNTTVRGNFTNVVVAGSNETVNKTTNNTTEVLRPDLEVTKIS